MNRFFLIGMCVVCLFMVSATVSNIELESKSLLNNKIEIKIPKSFEVMNPKMMKEKYPSEQRPSLIFTNASGQINMAINWMENPANQEVIPVLGRNFVTSFENMYPSAKWKDKGVKEIDGRKIGYFEVVASGVDTEIYNLMFFTDLDDRLLLCSFNCTEEDIKEWEPIAEEIMNSIKIK